jgi:hypothetical protein
MRPLCSEIISIRTGKRKGGADDIPHARDDLTTFLRAHGSFETALNGPAAEPELSAGG